MWPIEALTVYPAPRYRPIERALAGDSTITNLPRGACVRFFAEAAVFLRVTGFLGAIVVDRLSAGADAEFVIDE